MVNSRRPGLFRRSVTRGSLGFSYLIVIFLVFLLGLNLGAAALVWSQAVRRDKEDELIRAGQQIRSAIESYYLSSPGSVRRYPERLEQLLTDDRFVTTKRHLRRVPMDPISGSYATWQIIMAPEGGVMGVRSSAPGKPLKSRALGSEAPFTKAAERYSDWEFKYIPPQQSLRK